VVDVSSSGSGSSFAGALIAAIGNAADGVVGVRRSYRATGWHAQISKLTSSDRGYLAAEKAGISVNRRTLMDWLTERREPSAENQRKINAAYRLMAGQWPAQIQGKEFRITGLVKIGPDVRDRGNGMAAFLIDSGPADWSRMKRAWESGTELDEDEWEEWFVLDVIEPDLGEMTDPPEFPGTSYTVVIG
jgi:hypothetical protein